jgi:hypothetical protein
MDSVSSEPFACASDRHADALDEGVAWASVRQCPLTTRVSQSPEERRTEPPEESPRGWRRGLERRNEEALDHGIDLFGNLELMKMAGPDRDANL